MALLPADDKALQMNSKYLATSFKIQIPETFFEIASDGAFFEV